MTNTRFTSNGSDEKYGSEPHRNDESAAPSDSRIELAIQDWLIVNLAEAAGVDINAIDSRVPFTDYGIGSLQALKMSGELESWLGLKLPPTVLWDYPDIQQLSHYLAQEFQTALNQMKDEEIETRLQNLTSGKEGG